MYRIEDDYAAYCFDKAVMLFGLTFEGELHRAANDAKDAAQAKLAMARVQARWLDDGNDAGASPVERSFKDPAEKFK